MARYINAELSQKQITKQKAKAVDEIPRNYCTDCKHFVGCECFSGMTCDLFEKKAN